MGRFGGFGSAAGSRRVVHLAVAVAAISALMTVSALADTSTATKKTTKHSTHHTSSSASTAKPGDTCKPTPDQAGIGIRALQTELMVAGLKCSAEKWNSFTAKFKTMLKTDADRLQHAFSKAYGKSGSTEMNAFVTSLANEASQRSNGFSEADYCKQQDVLFEKVLALTEKDLERFSVGRKVNIPTPVALCTPDPVDGAPATTTAAAGTPGATPVTVQGATATVAVSTTPAPAGTPVSAKR